MRMDENDNPEWRAMLRGSTHGRKALEKIDALEAENEWLREQNQKLRRTLADTVMERDRMRERKCDD